MNGRPCTRCGEQSEYSIERRSPKGTAVVDHGYYCPDCALEKIKEDQEEDG